MIKSGAATRDRWPGVSARAQPWEARPAHAGPHAGSVPQIKPVHTARTLAQRMAVFLGGPIVRLPAAASRSLPAVASHAIGYAEPRPGTHSPGIGAYRG